MSCFESFLCDNINASMERTKSIMISKLQRFLCRDKVNVYLLISNSTNITGSSS